jgi:hypothetical protein
VPDPAHVADSVFDAEAQPSQLEKPRVILRRALHDFRQFNPLAASLYQHSENPVALCFRLHSIALANL